jgi:hypothetical protein
MVTASAGEHPWATRAGLIHARQHHVATTVRRHAPRARGRRRPKGATEPKPNEETMNAETQSTKPKTTKAEFVATFIKADGSPRTMRFASTIERVAAATGMITVWDVEKRSVRRLNLDTLVGRIIPLTA